MGLFCYLPQLSVKKIPLFVFDPFDAEAFKTYKSTKHLNCVLYYLCANFLSWVIKYITPTD